MMKLLKVNIRNFWLEIAYTVDEKLQDIRKRLRKQSATK